MCQPKLPANSLAVTILTDGRIKVETGSFAGAAHTSADKFLQVLLQELGVTVEQRESIGHVHGHEHGHDHSHDHIAAGAGGHHGGGK